MANRSLLHKSKLEDLKNWCYALGIKTEEGKGEFDVLRIYHPAFGFGVIYDRIRAKEHYTCDKVAEKIVRRFLFHRNLGIGGELWPNPACS